MKYGLLQGSGKRLHFRLVQKLIDEVGVSLRFHTFLALKNIERNRLIARYFSRPVLLDIARRGSAAHIIEDFRNLGIDVGRIGASAADFFEASFEAVNANYRCEYVYKTALANRIIFGRYSPRTASLNIELPVAGSIVDVAIFNGTSSAYEIKTEYDSNRRLSTQTPSYLKAFERVYVVVHPDMVAHYLDVIDNRVGVLSLNAKNQLKEVRASVKDVLRVEPETIFRMLRREEVAKIVQEKFGPQPEIPNGLINAHYLKFFQELTSVEAHEVFVRAMKARMTSEEDISFLRAVPKSLRALAYATPLSRPQRENLLSALATSF